MVRRKTFSFQRDINDFNFLLRDDPLIIKLGKVK